MSQTHFEIQTKWEKIELKQTVENKKGGPQRNLLEKNLKLMIK